MLQRLGLEEGEAIVHPWINRALERAQSKVEARNFDQRKNVLKYDDVMNDQRKVVFEQRIELMDGDTVQETVIDMRHDVIDTLVVKHIPEKAYPEQWDTKGLEAEVKRIFDLDLPVHEWAQEEGIADEEVRERLKAAADESAARKVAKYSADIWRQVEKSVLLQTLDHLWREHLATLDHLRSVIGFRGYAQRDPLQEYKTEAFQLFEAMLTQLREMTTAQLMRIEIAQAPQLPTDDLDEYEAHHMDPFTGEDEMAYNDDGHVNGGGPGDVGADTLPRTVRRPASERNPADPTTWGKIGRNEACPCGSGKKYKHCHGRLN
jgi:preprotein translocase subunit SecA